VKAFEDAERIEIAFTSTQYASPWVPNFIPLLSQRPSQKVRSAAGFHSDQLRVQISCEAKKLRSRQLLAHHHLAAPIKPNQMKYCLAKIIFLAALVLGVFVCGRIGFSYWVDLLWFRSLGYGEVFWKSVGLQIAAFVVFAGTTFLILYGAFSAIRRSHEADLPRAHAIVIAGEPISLSVQPVLRVISFCVSIVIACVTGLGLMADWPTLALF
jgi:hypothetical protein